MRKHSPTVLLIAGLMSCTAGLAAEPPGVIKLQDLTGRATTEQGKKWKKGDICWTRSLYTEAWSCSSLGMVTISQVYDLGWRVADMSSGGNGAPAWLVIEEQ